MSESHLPITFPQVNSELKEADTIPLTGFVPPFPWEEVAKKLSKVLEREITFETGSFQWRTQNTLTEGIGADLFALNIAVPTINSTLCWIFPQADITLLESLILTKDPHPVQFQDPSLSESFYKFLVLEFIYQLSQSGYNAQTIPQLTNSTAIPTENALCLDVGVKIEGHTLWGRLLIPQTFRQSWLETFLKKGSSSTAQKLKKEIPTSVHFEVGRTIINCEEWENISVGDCVLLDTCAFDKNGKVVLTINGKAIRHAQVTDNKLKIT